MLVALYFRDPTLQLECSALTGEERLGQATRFELELSSRDRVDPARVLGAEAALVLQCKVGGQKSVFGVITSFTARGCSPNTTQRRYRAVLRSRLAHLDHNLRPRVFHAMTVAEIITKVLVDGGVYAPSNIHWNLAGRYDQREHCVQWRETDSVFLRRLCEEEGIYFLFQSGDDEAIVFADTSSSAPALEGGPIPVVDPGGFSTNARAATDLEANAILRPGKVTLRDYDCEHPAVALEAVVGAGSAIEKGVEVYEGPGGFRSPERGSSRARTRLESLRADALRVTCRVNFADVAPGNLIELEAAPDYGGIVAARGEHFVVAVRFAYGGDETRGAVELEAVPRATPFRLAKTTKKPRIDGVHSASVVGPPGKEIHVDALGRVKLRFPWDRESKDADSSSSWVRVAQPNTPGSMLLPRVGWEVAVMFEDGDPDRPYVLGRVYNAAYPPPRALPINKTMTSIATSSSPAAEASTPSR